MVGADRDSLTRWFGRLQQERNRENRGRFDLWQKMKRAYRKTIIVVAVAGVWLAGFGEVCAYVESHPPFPSGKPVPYATLKTTPVIAYDYPAQFADGNLRIETAKVADDQVTTRVVVGAKVLLDTIKESPDMPAPAGSRVFYTDLTGDGRKDILIYAYPGSNGLGASIEMADLLIAQPDGAYHHESFEAFAAGPEDFIDVNGDGRYEMLWVNNYFEGDHSYWVYRVVEIGEDGLRLNDKLIPDFPKIIWFTEKPNDQPTQKLTATEREDLIHQSTTKWQETYRQ